MPCGCPDAVFSVLSAFVSEVFGHIQQVLYYRTLLGNIEGAVNDEVAGQVGQVVDQIPLSPGLLSPADVIQLASCPLTPTALAVLAYKAKKKAKDPTEAATEFSTAPVTSQLDRAKEMYRYYANDLSVEYERGLQALSSYNLIQSMKQYLASAKNVGLTPDALALARTVTSQVQGTCSEAYVGSVFERFDVETIGFAFDGAVPTQFNGPAGEVMRSLAEGDSRLAGWRAVSAAV